MHLQPQSRCSLHFFHLQANLLATVRLSHPQEIIWPDSRTFSAVSNILSNTVSDRFVRLIEFQALTRVAQRLTSLLLAPDAVDRWYSDRVRHMVAAKCLLEFPLCLYNLSLNY